jgi:hypothetical protein
VTLNQTSRTFAKVDANQRARNVIETIESKLHSSCVAEGVTPIIAGSTATSLSFISKYGSANKLTPEKHTITMNGTTTAPGTLVETVYPFASGTNAAPVFSTTPTSTTTLMENVQPPRDGGPTFSYFAFGLAKDSGGRNYIDSSNNPYMILLDGSSTLPSGITTSTGAAVAPGTMPANSPTALGVPLSTDNAKITSEVMIEMLVTAGGDLGTNKRYDTAPPLGAAPVEISSAVALRLTPPPSEGNLPSVPPCA